MAKVLLKNVTKKFGKVIAINRLSMEVKDKEFVVLHHLADYASST